MIEVSVFDDGKWRTILLTPHFDVAVEAAKNHFNPTHGRRWRVQITVLSLVP